MAKGIIKFIRIEVYMKNPMKRRLVICSAVLLVLALVTVLGLTLSQNLNMTRKKEAEYILNSYADNLMLRFKGELNETGVLAQIADIMEGDDDSWFDSAAAPLLRRKEVRYVCLIRGDTIVRALPNEDYGYQAGRDLKDFSYIYTMAKVVKDLVIEGPVTIEGDKKGGEVFLFLQPYLEENVYLGEVAVALERDYVIQQLGLEYLSDRGFDYELWRVGPQNGDKEIVAVSAENLDFSQAVKTTFYLPSQWNLSIQPKTGWLSTGYRGDGDWDLLRIGSSDTGTCSFSVSAVSAGTQAKTAFIL